MPYRVQYCEEFLPDTLAPGVVYVRRTDGMPWAVSFVCPCGNHDKEVYLPVNRPNEQPGWQFQDRDGRPHLEPSILFTDKKACHFFLHDGEVRWC